MKAKANYTACTTALYSVIHSSFIKYLLAYYESIYLSILKHGYMEIDLLTGSLNTITIVTRNEQLNDITHS